MLDCLEIPGTFTLTLQFAFTSQGVAGRSTENVTQPPAVLCGVKRTRGVALVGTWL
jgi:hypothetical protein